jgi:hypothetical protein
MLPPMSIDQDGGTSNQVVIHFSEVWPAQPVCGAPMKPSTSEWGYVTCAACLELRAGWRETEDGD